MKKFAQSLLVIVAAAASFSACKKEVLQPNNGVPITMEAQSLRGNFPPIKTAPKLVKKGVDSLVYNADGSLQKVMASASWYKTFTKSGNILTVTYFNNNAFAGKVEYTLDAAGRAAEDKHIGFPANNGTTPKYVYQYDGSNHLIKRYNKANPAICSKFFWGGADGKQLSIVKWYNGSSSYDFMAVYFTYAPETDHLKTWSKRTGLDMYLDIFGSRPTKMVDSEDMQNYDSTPISKHEYFFYDYNADGYPVQRASQFYGLVSGETIYYKYSQ